MPVSRERLLFSLIACAGAMAKDAPMTAAMEAALALALPLHLKKLEKLGGRPDYAVAPTAEFFRRSFDVALIATLSFPKADDARSLIDWVRAAHKAG